MKRQTYTVRVTHDIEVLATDDQQAKRLALAHAIGRMQTEEGEDVWLESLQRMRTNVRVMTMRV